MGMLWFLLSFVLLLVSIQQLFSEVWPDIRAWLKSRYIL